MVCLVVLKVQRLGKLRSAGLLENGATTVFLQCAKLEAVTLGGCMIFDSDYGCPKIIASVFAVAKPTFAPMPHQCCQKYIS